MNGNPLSPDTGPDAAQGAPGLNLGAGLTPPLNPTAGSQSASLVQRLGARHDQVKAQYQQVGEALGRLDAVKNGLANLAKLGDMVTSDDVVKEAGKLVAAGLDPKALASLMSEMPARGQALALWLSQHATGAAAREAQLVPVLQSLRYSMGQNALHLLAADHLDSMAQSASAPEMTPTMGSPLSG
jgi:hypothetical protein